MKHVNRISLISAFALTLTILAGCTQNGCPNLECSWEPYTDGWQNANGQSCKGPAPGCDYYNTTTDGGYYNQGGLIDVSADPYVPGGQGNAPNYTTQTWTFTAANGATNTWYGSGWLSPDGIMYNSSGDPLNSTHSGVQTKDTDLQHANVQQAALESAAQHVAAQFQMSVVAARQLVTVADRMNQLVAQGQGQITAADRMSVVSSVLSVGGVSTDDVNTALANSLKGDMTTANALVEKAATNLGMPDSQTLRNKLLPAYGINVQ